MSNQLMKCKACGHDVAKGAKKCPHCGKDQRNFFMRHKIITGILVLFVFGMIGALGSQGGDKATNTSTNTTSTDSSTNDTSAEVAEATPTPIPVIEVTAEQLCKDYADNEIKANQTYKDQVVFVTGEVTEIGESLGMTYVVLSSGEEFSLSNVQCFFKDDNEIAKLADLTNGQKVSIIGVCDGLSLNVSVNDCYLK